MERVRGLVRPQPGLAQAMREGFGWRPPGTPPFIGQVGSDRFVVRRDIRYRNSFLPHVRGQVRPSPGGSRIVLAMRLHSAVLAFVLLWLGYAAAMAVVLLYRAAPSDSLVPAAMFLFGGALTAGGFYPEAVIARRRLELALSARPVDCDDRNVRGRRPDAEHDDALPRPPG